MDNSNFKVVKLGMSFIRKTKMHKSFADDWRFWKKLLNYSTIYEQFMVKTIFLVRILMLPTFHQNIPSANHNHGDYMKWSDYKWIAKFYFHENDVNSHGLRGLEHQNREYWESFRKKTLRCNCYYISLAIRLQSIQMIRWYKRSNACSS